MIYTPALLALASAATKASSIRAAADDVASVTFAVADVTMGSVAELREMTLKDTMADGASIVAQSEVPLVSYTGPQTTSTASNLFVVPDEKCYNEWHPDTEYGLNGLLKAAHLAYASHYGLTLSPDVIHVAILQAISNIVTQDPDKYRAKLGIQFEGEKQVTLDSDRADTQDKWEQLILGFRGSIGKDIPDDLNKLLGVEFSTTTPLSTAVASLSVMDIYKHYYRFSFATACGIPKIKLEGSPADWAQLQFNTIKLFNKLGYAGRWGKHLFPVLKEFSNAAGGNANVTFWNSLYKYKGPDGSFGDVVTGWINVFYPFVYVSGWSENKCLDWEKCSDKEALSPSFFPQGTSQVPVAWVQYPEKKYNVTGGIIGIEKDPATNFLKPTLGWAVIEYK